MSNLQTTLNNDGTISIIIPVLKHPLYGISLDDLDALPKSLGAEEFCASSQKDKLWEIRSITFDKPANEVRRIKKLIEAIADYVQLERLKTDAVHRYDILVADQQKREKELVGLREKVKTPPAPPKEGVEYVANLPVADTIQAKLSMQPVVVNEVITNQLTIDAYNRLLVEAFDQLPKQDKEALNSATQLIKATFDGYYLTTEGLRKVVLELVV